MEELKQGCKIKFVGVYKDNLRRAMPGTASKAIPNDARGLTKVFLDFLNGLKKAGETEGYFAIQDGNQIYKSVGPTKWHEGVYDHRRMPKCGRFRTAYYCTRGYSSQRLWSSNTQDACSKACEIEARSLGRGCCSFWPRNRAGYRCYWKRSGWLRRYRYYRRSRPFYSMLCNGPLRANPSYHASKYGLKSSTTSTGSRSKNNLNLIINGCDGILNVAGGNLENAVYKVSVGKGIGLGNEKTSKIRFIHRRYSQFLHISEFEVYDDKNKKVDLSNTVGKLSSQYSTLYPASKAYDGLRNFVASSPSSLTHAKYKYESNFDDGKMNDWNCKQITTCGNYGKVCGGYGVTGKGYSMTKTFRNLRRWKSYTITLDFIAIDSWDGEQANVYVNGRKCAWNVNGKYVFLAKV